MIDYSTLKVGDKLRITGQGAPGFAKLGDIVTVVSCNGHNRCDVVTEGGESAYFALTCGASRLELVGLLGDPEGPRPQSKQETEDDLREAILAYRQEIARLKKCGLNQYGELVVRSYSDGPKAAEAPVLRPTRPPGVS